MRDQNWKDYEHIIVDGDSTDGSKEYIQTNAASFSYAISEKDQGIYNAMNKGISKASGEYLLMLNAGDLLYDNKVLHNVFGLNNHTADIIYGDVDRESKGVVFAESIFPDRLTFGFLRFGMISHQAAFFKRELHSTVGPYNEDIKYGADWHFIIVAICKFNASHLHLKFKVAICNADGLTCNPIHFDKMREEKINLIRDLFPAFHDDYLILDDLENKKLATKITLLKRSILKIIKGILKS